MSEVIGEGSYGCVHRPSLQCTKKKVGKNKISKLMTRKHLNKELKEFKRIQKIDKKNNFYLGKPSSCKPKKSKYNKKSIKDCEDFNYDKIDDYELLLMDNGGITLEKFAKNMESSRKSRSNTQKVELFFIEVHRLIYGLKQFLINDSIHHDVKPLNIVYNEKDNRLNYIDFGFMNSIEQIKEEARTSTYEFGISYWYFPMEYMFMNYNEYVRLVNKSSSQRLNFVKYVTSNNQHNVTQNVNMFYDFLSCSREYQKKNNAGLFHSINSQLADKYEDFLDTTLRTFDIYGLGLSLYYVLNHVKHLLSDDLAEKLRIMFEKMITANMDERYRIDDLLRDYEEFLEDSKLLSKYNVAFESHLLRKREIPLLSYLLGSQK